MSNINDRASPHRSDVVIDRLVSREPEKVISRVFYGYSAQTLAAWCQVPLRTAQRWKRGERFPDKQSFRLFELHRDGRILSEEHWPTWRVVDDVLCDEDGVITTQGQLRAYVLVYQLAAELTRDSRELQEQLHAIMRHAG